MEGTVNCASLDDGRPALAGAVATTDRTGAAAFFSMAAVADPVDLDLEEAVVGIGLADVLETGMGTELARARGLEIGEVTGFEPGLVALVTALAAAFLGWTTALAAGFAVGLVAALGAAFTAAFDGIVGLTAAFAATLTAGLAVGFADALLTVTGAGLTGLAAGFPLAWATACTLLLAAVVLLSFPDLAFTSCLLADLSCAWSVGPAVPPRPLEGFAGGTSPARECTGFPKGKPNSCKIETIIWLSLRK